MSTISTVGSLSAAPASASAGPSPSRVPAIAARSDPCVRIVDVPVELDGREAGGAGVGRERVQQRGLADAGEPVDVSDDRAFGLEQAAELGAFAVTPRDRAGLLREESSERLRHDRRRYGPQPGCHWS